MTPTRRAPPARVAIALGSNLGDRRAHLRWAVRALRTRVRHATVSGFENTTPEGVPDAQPDYLNAVLVGYTTLGPADLLAWLLELEQRRGRERVRPRAARTLDLDLILYANVIHRSRTLRLPHPRFRSRPFVLGPLAALAPRWKDPESGVTMARLWRTRGLPGRG